MLFFYPIQIPLKEVYDPNFNPHFDPLSEEPRAVKTRLKATR